MFLCLSFTFNYAFFVVVKIGRIGDFYKLKICVFSDCIAAVLFFTSSRLTAIAKMIIVFGSNKLAKGVEGEVLLRVTSVRACGLAAQLFLYFLIGCPQPQSPSLCRSSYSYNNIITYIVVCLFLFRYL